MVPNASQVKSDSQIRSLAPQQLLAIGYECLLRAPRQWGHVENKQPKLKGMAARRKTAVPDEDINHEDQL